MNIKQCHTSYVELKLSNHGLPILQTCVVFICMGSLFAKRCLRKHEDAYEAVLGLVGLVGTIFGMEHNPHEGQALFSCYKKSQKKPKITVSLPSLAEN